MARLRYNGLSNSLGASLTSGGTTITFASKLTYAGGDVPTLSGSDYIPLSILDVDGNCAEVVHLTAYTSAATTGTIARGKEDTSGAAHDSGRTVINGPTALSEPGDLIGYTAYNPGTISAYGTTSATLENVDATNLSVTFTVPPSGAVVAVLGALVYPSSSTGITWGLRDGSGQVGLDSRVCYGNVQLRPAFSQRISGLTPGSSLTWYFAHHRDEGGGTPNTYAGGVAGPAIMEIYAV